MFWNFFGWISKNSGEVIISELPVVVDAIINASNTIETVRDGWWNHKLYMQMV